MTPLMTTMAMMMMEEVFIVGSTVACTHPMNVTVVGLECTEVVGLGLNSRVATMNCSNMVSGEIRMILSLLLLLYRTL